jgi:hypothetical protein
MEFKVVEYIVHGNVRRGFEVDGAYYVGEINAKSTEIKDIKKALKEGNFYIGSNHGLQFRYNYNRVDITKRNGQPVGELQVVGDERLPY